MTEAEKEAAPLPVRLERRVGLVCSYCKSVLRYDNEQGWGYTKDLGEMWVMSCPICCAEAGGGVRDIDINGFPGNARY